MARKVRSVGVARTKRSVGKFSKLETENGEEQLSRLPGVGWAIDGKVVVGVRGVVLDCRVAPRGNSELDRDNRLSVVETHRRGHRDGKSQVAGNDVP